MGIKVPGKRMSKRFEHSKVFGHGHGKKSVFALGVSMSDDGKTVAYLSADPTLPYFPNPQAVVARSDGTGARRIGAEVPEGLHALLLSGDGRVLYQ